MADLATRFEAILADDCWTQTEDVLESTPDADRDGAPRMMFLESMDC